MHRSVLAGFRSGSPPVRLTTSYPAKQPRLVIGTIRSMIRAYLLQHPSQRRLHCWVIRTRAFLILQPCTTHKDCSHARNPAFPG